MKNWIKPLALAAGVFIASSSMAQQLSPEERIEKMNAHLAQELSLTPEQMPLVAEANKTMVFSVRDARANKDRSAAKQARDTYQETLKGILSPEQFEKYQAMAKNSRKKMRLKRNLD